MNAEAMELRAALATVAIAAEMLKVHDGVFVRYLIEAQRMDAVGPFLNPTLFLSPERQKVDEALRPLMAATRTWLAVVDKTRNLVIAFSDHRSDDEVAGE